MKTSRQTELLLSATGLALAGTIANEPLVTTIAALGALLSIRGPIGPLFDMAAGVAESGCGRWSPSPQLPSHFALRRFQGGETPPAEEETAGARSDRGSQAYQEFAAHLEDDAEEEISFMPHYASDTVDTRLEGAGPSPSATDSLISEDLREVEPQASKMPIPRRFALGTVAIIRRLLEPGQVEQILLEQRRYPRLRFGDVAVQLGLLTESELQELLAAQDGGIFSDEEISDARRRLAAYHNGLGD